MRIAFIGKFADVSVLRHDLVPGLAVSGSVRRSYKEPQSDGGDPRDTTPAHRGSDHLCRAGATCPCARRQPDRLRAQDGPAQVYVLPAAGGEPEQITKLPLGAGAPVWSPDGTKLAFAAPVDLHAAAGEDDKARTSRAGEPIVADRINYQSDGAGFLRTIRSHMHVVELATKECRQQTAGDWHAEQPSWSPDSTRLAFAAATAPDADLSFYAPVYVLDVSDPRAQPVRIGPPDVSGGRTTWTADGSAVLVVGTVGRPVGHARLLRIPLDGGDIADLAGTLDRNVLQGGPGYPGTVPQLTGDARTVLFCIRDAGCTHLYALTDGGPP